MAFITLDMLIMLGACQEQLDLFAANWPNGGEGTEENFVTTALYGGNIQWFASKTLSPELLERYVAFENEAWAEYEVAAESCLSLRRGLINVEASSYHRVKDRHRRGEIPRQEAEAALALYKTRVDEAIATNAAQLADLMTALREKLGRGLARAMGVPPPPGGR